ncbi:DNA polymerase III subunits gamma and tau [compost metagenome]
MKVAVGDAVNGTAAAIEAGKRDARRADAAKAVQQDKFVQDLVDIFGAKVVDSTIKAGADKA